MKTVERDYVLGYEDVYQSLCDQVNEHLVHKVLDHFWYPWEGDDPDDHVWLHVIRTLFPWSDG